MSIRTMGTAIRVGAAVAGLALGGLVAGGTAASAAPPVVLGVPGLMGEHAIGWGTVKPREIYNGGVPSGSIRKITWRRWGTRTAYGSGMTPIYSPRGGYYTTLGRARLRAYDRGSCTPGGPLVYRKLKVRTVEKPGGRLGKWFLWGGMTSLCGDD
ncbi:MAG: hypothetical protein WC558_00930 [Patulibacter sp.]